MSDLVRANENSKHEGRNTIISFIVGLVAILIIFFALASWDAVFIVNYLDVPSFIWLLVLQLVILAMAGQLGNFVQATKAAFSLKNSEAELSSKAQDYEYALDFAIKTTIIAGITVALFGIIDVLQNVWQANIDLLGVNIAVRLMAIFYSMIIVLILLSIKGRLHKIR